jgi:Protein of unknown function (DUF2742)
MSPERRTPAGQGGGTSTPQGNSDSIASRQVSWWSVHQYVEPLLESVCQWPMVGTPQWCKLADDDPAKAAGLYDAAQHHALRLELNQEARCEASRAISATVDWAQVSREMLQLASFRNERGG